MKNKRLLTEGGVVGHMSHLHENGSLTFKKIKEIFTAASNGELQGTEKTDGQNLNLSYSVQRGIAVAARNKGNIKQGGLTGKELAAKFQGRGGLEQAFNESFEVFEKAVRSLDPKTQLQIFGDDADIYYNAEVMDPRSPNVVNYDTKSLVIHQVGHAEYDKTTGNRTDRDVSKNAKILSDVLSNMQEATAQDDYTVHINAVRNLEALDDDIILSETIQKLDQIVASVGLSDGATINEYLIARLAPVVQENFPELDEATHKLILRRLLKDGISLTQITKGKEQSLRTKISQFIKTEKLLLQKAVAPVEVTIHDFGVEMLRGLESAFILDNSKEIQRLRHEVSQAISAIEGSSHDGAMEVLKRHMEKLKNIENVSTASEGFVFDYDGHTYKFTGNFAPINQILGLFKYGRGDIPAMVKEEEMDERDSNRYYGTLSEEGGEKADVAVVPGAFKPPHRGHLAMVKYYTTLANRVVVWISPVTRKLPDSKQEITLDMAKKVWDVYLKHEGISNVVVVEQAPTASPVGAAYKYIGEEAKPGETVILGSSTKPDDKGTPDYMRFKNAGKYAGEGVTPLYGPEYAVDHNLEEFTHPLTGKAYSASDLRQIIDNGDDEGFSHFLPDGLQERAPEILNILKEEKESLQESSSLIINLIKEELSEVNAAACGGVAGVAVKVGKKTSDYNAWEDEEELSEFKGDEENHGNFEMDLEDAVGIPRDEMPQIKSTDMQDFIGWLSEQGVQSKTTMVMVDDLTPTQKKINVTKVKGMLEKKTIEQLANSKPVLVTSDMHLIDGHHRWFALYVDDSKNNISTVIVDSTLEEFLSIANSYPKVSYKSMVDERIVNQIFNEVLQAEGYENFGGQTKMLKVGSVRLDIEDMELEPSKHGEERRFRHTKPGGGGHKISKDAIVSAVDRSLGLIMNDYANGELENGEAFHIRMKGKSRQVPALNVIAALDMQKGPDTIKIITVMRKDDFKTNNFGGGSQKTYNVGM